MALNQAHALWLAYHLRGHYGRAGWPFDPFYGLPTPVKTAALLWGEHLVPGTMSVELDEVRSDGHARLWRRLKLGRLKDGPPVTFSRRLSTTQRNPQETNLARFISSNRIGARAHPEDPDPFFTLREFLTETYTPLLGEAGLSYVRIQLRNVWLRSGEIAQRIELKGVKSQRFDVIASHAAYAHGPNRNPVLASYSDRPLDPAPHAIRLADVRSGEAEQILRTLVEKDLWLHWEATKRRPPSAQAVAEKRVYYYAHLLSAFPKYFEFAQQWALHALADAVRDGKRELDVDCRAPGSQFAAIALIDVATLAENCGALLGLGSLVPKLRFHFQPGHDPLDEEFIWTYLQDERERQQDLRLDSLRAGIELTEDPPSASRMWTVLSCPDVLASGEGFSPSSPEQKLFARTAKRARVGHSWTIRLEREARGYFERRFDAPLAPSPHGFPRRWRGQDEFACTLGTSLEEIARWIWSEVA